MWLWHHSTSCLALITKRCSSLIECLHGVLQHELASVCVLILLVPVQRAQVIAVRIGQGLLGETVILLTQAPLHASAAQRARLSASQIILCRCVRLRQPGNARRLLLLWLQGTIVEIIFCHFAGWFPLPLKLTLFLTIFSGILSRELPLECWFEGVLVCSLVDIVLD